MAKMVRWVKVYKQVMQGWMKRVLRKKRMENLEVSGESLSDGVQGHSRVGRELSEFTTKLVIVAVLIMLILLPSVSVTPPRNTSLVLNQLLADEWCLGEADQYVVVAELVTRELNLTPEGNPHLLQLILQSGSRPNVTVVSMKEAFFKSLRPLEWISYNSQYNATCNSTITLSLKSEVELDSTYAIFTSLFISIILLLWATLFASDAQHYVLSPIECMVDTVDKMSRDPLSQLTTQSNQNSGIYEITLLQNTIEKIGNLLRIGFGEAGSRIIRRNLKVGAELNVLIPGNTVHALFSFCDIRSFNQATEILQVHFA